MENTTTRKIICSRCGGSNVEPGMLADQSVVAFLPKKESRLLRRSVKVVAEMCFDCGAIQLTGDVQQIADLVKE